MEWVYRYMVGIDTCSDAPGYKRFVIHPCPGGGISHAKAALETVRGRIECGWALQEGTLTLDITVPSNTSAKVQLPDGVSGITDSCGLDFTREGGTFTAQAHAGTWHIVCSM